MTNLVLDKKVGITKKSYRVVYKWGEGHNALDPVVIGETMFVDQIPVIIQRHKSLHSLIYDVDYIKQVRNGKNKAWKNL